MNEYLNPESEIENYGCAWPYGGKVKAEAKRFTITELNGLGKASFARVVGPVFEDSPWIAEHTWQERPFASLEAFHRALCGTVLAAAPPQKLALIRAHPDLVGRAALAGTLTPASTREQASAGLDGLSQDEISLFARRNAEYRERFGFPFVICARLNKKAAILAGFAQRLQHSQEQEMDAALAEIFKIAWLRLQDLCV